jgi:hypothetical protein
MTLHLGGNVYLGGRSNGYRINHHGNHHGLFINEGREGGLLRRLPSFCFGFIAGFNWFCISNHSREWDELTVKMSKLQRRLYENGLVGRIAHNLAKYKVAVEGAYSESEFLFACQAYMADRGVDHATIMDWMFRAELQAKDEISFFVTHGKFANSAGGTSMAIGALIGPVLDELGYGGNEE